MSEKTDVWQGTLALMVLKTLEALGSLHGYLRRLKRCRDIPRKSLGNDKGLKPTAKVVSFL